jgi:hypothetical protein
MKSKIQQAAAEYAAQDRVTRSEHVAFVAGVEFAQRWISVEDELPPCSDVDILIKGIDYRGKSGIVDIGYMHESTPRVENFISLSGEILTVTHWRHIDMN